MVLDASPMENSPARVLIIDTAWLGDVLFTTALIGAVRERWPNCVIDLLTAPRARELVEHHPEISEVWIYDKHGRESGIGSLKNLALKLNEKNFDICLCAHPSARSRYLCSLLSVPVRVGYRGFLASRAFTHIIHNDLAIEPDHVERRINLLRAITDVARTPPLKIGLTRDEQLWADEHLNSLGASHGPFLGLVPGSARRTKQWDIERFSRLALQWRSDNPDGSVLVFLGPKETDMHPQFAALQNHGVFVIQDSLRHCAVLLSKCLAVVGNDTGVSFLALAAGCPKVLVLYGSTQVNYTFPAPHRAIAAGVPCCLPRTGHGEARCNWTNGPPWCMSQISIDRIQSDLR